MILGIVLLVLLLIVLAFAVLGGGDPGTASASGSPSAATSSSPSALPSSPAPSAGTSSAAPSGSSTPSTAPDAIPRDTVVETTVERISVRGGPSVDAERLGSVELGTVGFVVDGPVQADGFSWYLVSAMGLPPNSGCAGPFTTDPYNCPAWFGWLAGRSENGDAWLAAHALECPAAPLTAGTVILGRTNLERLACFGAEPITFRAFWPELPDDAGTGGSCAAQAEPSGWLYCQSTNDAYVTIDEADVGTTVSIDPASGVAMPPRGTWIELRVHLDDPAAEDCDDAADVADDPASPERAVLDCRAQMVVESAVAVDGP
ncbi:MAG: hypothetical protein K5924_06205 [Chloroflexi bacterium]|nr:hypothetical protein [Chloroflexota bacterium]